MQVNFNYFMPLIFLVFILICYYRQLEIKKQFDWLKGQIRTTRLTCIISVILRVRSSHQFRIALLPRFFSQRKAISCLKLFEQSRRAASFLGNLVKITTESSVYRPVMFLYFTCHQKCREKYMNMFLSFIPIFTI